MERKEQDHQQELERLRQTTSLEKERLCHEAKLKLKSKEVHIIIITQEIHLLQKTVIPVLLLLSSL